MLYPAVLQLPISPKGKTGQICKDINKTIVFAKVFVIIKMWNWNLFKYPSLFKS